MEVGRVASAASSMRARHSVAASRRRRGRARRRRRRASRTAASGRAVVIACSMASDHSTHASTLSGCGWVSAATSAASPATASRSPSAARATGPVRISAPLPAASGGARWNVSAASRRRRAVARGVAEHGAGLVADVAWPAVEPAHHLGADLPRRRRRPAASTASTASAIWVSSVHSPGSQPKPPPPSSSHGAARVGRTELVRGAEGVAGGRGQHGADGAVESVAASEASMRSTPGVAHHPVPRPPCGRPRSHPCRAGAAGATCRAIRRPSGRGRRRRPARRSASGVKLLVLPAWNPTLAAGGVAVLVGPEEDERPAAVAQRRRCGRTAAAGSSPGWRSRAPSVRTTTSWSASSPPRRSARSSSSPMASYSGVKPRGSKRPAIERTVPSGAASTITSWRSCVVELHDRDGRLATGARWLAKKPVEARRRRRGRSTPSSPSGRAGTRCRRAGRLRRPARAVPRRRGAGRGAGRRAAPSTSRVPAGRQRSGAVDGTDERAGDGPGGVRAVLEAGRRRATAGGGIVASTARTTPRGRASRRRARPSAAAGSRRRRRRQRRHASTSRSRASSSAQAGDDAAADLDGRRSPDRAGSARRRSPPASPRPPWRGARRG